MSYSVKMAKLDFYTFKSQFLNYVALAFMIMMFCYMGSSIITLGITVSWFIALVMTNIFVVQEKNNLERLYASLSIDLENIIYGRYLFIFANYVVALAVSISIGVGVSLFRNIPVSFMEILTACSVSLLIFSMIMGIQIPIYFRYGYTKAKVRGMIPYLFVLGIIILPSFTKVFSSAFAFMMQHQLAMNVVCLLMSAIILFVSYKTAISCYKKRK
ncbi:ABC-2 transporter permease [Fusibacter bizertensis]